MGLALNLKLNNQSVSDHLSSVVIVNDHFTLSWDFDILDKISVDTDTGKTTDVGDFDQVGYEVKISNSDYEIGNSGFVGDASRTGYVATRELFWNYSGFPLSRGSRYYGQVYAIDDANRTTELATFSFLYNSVPVASNLLVSPNLPSPTDDLVLTYDYLDMDEDVESGTVIRWFKNGVHQRQFDNSKNIRSTFLQNNDLWNADVYPSDGLEHGVRATSDQVKVLSTAITVSNLEILPTHPNPDDIIKANYGISDEFEEENVLIRWYVNSVIRQEFNDQKCVKLNIIPGDVVRFEIKHINSPTYVASSNTTVVLSDYVVYDIKIDGKTNPLDVSTISPHVRWKRFTPSGESVNFISIKIGTFFESNNIYSTTITGDRNVFTIPPNTLEKGRDYYIGISLSRTEVFSNYTTSNFRISGSRWEEDVSNSTGWTMETMFSTNTPSEADKTDYNTIRINDGSRFAEIRMYADKISLISGSTKEYAVSTITNNFLGVIGKNDDIKIYLNRELIIDGTGVLTQESSVKSLELAHESSTSAFTISYKYFFYTTSGYFLPGESSEYTNLQFHEYIEFQNSDIVSLQGYVGGKHLFGLNSNSDTESSSIYLLGTGDSEKVGAIARSYSPISKINKSPDGTKTIAAHANGVSIITGYVINPFSHELEFVSDAGVLNEVTPNASGWELVENTHIGSAYFETDGFHIDTTK